MELRIAINYDIIGIGIAFVLIYILLLLLSSLLMLLSLLLLDQIEFVLN